MSEPRDVTPETENPAPAEATAEAQPEAPKGPAPTAIAMREGALAPKDNMELVRVLDNVAKGGGFPERFDTREKRIAAYNLAHSLMAGQWQLALNHIAIIKGQMAIYGELPGTLAERTGEVEEKHVYLIDKSYNKICTDNKNLDAEIFAAVCKIKRKGREMKEFTYSMDEAREAGQYPPMKWDKKTQQKVLNDDSPWEKFTKVMLMRKAMALGLKIEFPEAFAGVPIAEYDFDEAPDLVDVTPKSNQEEKADRVRDLNARFSSPQVHAEPPANPPVQ